MGYGYGVWDIGYGVVRAVSFTNTQIPCAVCHCAMAACILVPHTRFRAFCCGMRLGILALYRFYYVCAILVRETRGVGGSPSLSSTPRDFTYEHTREKMEKRLSAPFKAHPFARAHQCQIRLSRTAFHRRQNRHRSTQ